MGHLGPAHLCLLVTEVGAGFARDQPTQHFEKSFGREKEKMSKM